VCVCVCVLDLCEKENRLKDREGGKSVCVEFTRGRDRDRESV